MYYGVVLNGLTALHILTCSWIACFIKLDVAENVRKYTEECNLWCTNCLCSTYPNNIYSKNNNGLVLGNLGNQWCGGKYV